jgi:hypothetical protein
MSQQDPVKKATLKAYLTSGAIVVLSLLTFFTFTNKMTMRLGNKNSKIYQLSNCPNYNDIAPQNRVPFKTEDEAQKAGFRKAKNSP